MSAGSCAKMRTSPSGPSRHGGRRTHRSGAADRQAVSPSWRRRGRLSQPWRPLRLFAGRPAAPGARCLRKAGLRPCVPVPAGGMTPERVPEMLDFYGADVMLLIGGGLLEAREQLTEETAAFVGEVEAYRHSRRSRRCRRPNDPPQGAQRTIAGTASSSFPTRRTSARCSRRSPARCCSPIRSCAGSCAISRSRRAASRRSNGTSTCMPC